MNKTVKIIVFVASVAITLGALHLTVGKHHPGGFCGQKEMPCRGEFFHHPCDDKPDCSYKATADSLHHHKAECVTKDTVHVK